MWSRSRNLSLSVGMAVCLLLAASGANAQTGGPATPQVVLYDQTDQAASNTARSTIFTAPNLSSGSAKAAEDFPLVCTGSCNITSVDVKGQIQNGASIVGSVVSLEFYTDGGSLPATLLYAADIPLDPIGNDFTVTLNPTLYLGSGRWWVSVAPKSGTNTTWAWRERLTASGAYSAWQNPYGYWTPSCIAWGTRVTTCRFPSGSTGPDLLFSVSGTNSGPNLTPAITGFTPAYRLPNASGVITLTGVNFATGATVTWNGVNEPATYIDGTHISINPAAQPYGNYPVIVTNAGSCIDYYGNGDTCESASRSFPIGIPTYLPLIRR